MGKTQTKSYKKIEPLIIKYRINIINFNLNKYIQKQHSEIYFQKYRTESLIPIIILLLIQTFSILLYAKLQIGIHVNAIYYYNYMSDYY